MGSRLDYAIKSLVNGIQVLLYQFDVDGTNNPDAVKGRGFTVTRRGVGHFRIQADATQHWFLWIPLGAPAVVGASSDSDYNCLYGTIDPAPGAATAAYADILLNKAGTTTNEDNRRIAGAIAMINSGNSINIATP